MRKLHIDNEEWQYRVGEGTVVVVPPEGKGKKIYIPCYKIKCCSPDNFDRGKWKKTSDGMITPSELKKYIKEHYEN